MHLDIEKTHAQFLRWLPVQTRLMSHNVDALIDRCRCSQVLVFLTMHYMNVGFCAQTADSARANKSYQIALCPTTANKAVQEREKAQMLSFLKL